MKYLLINLSFLFVVIFGCRQERVFEKKYYQNDVSHWFDYLTEIGVEKPDLSEKIIIVVGSNLCQPCEYELQMWERFYQNDNIDIDFIVVERYTQTYNQLLSTLNLSFNSYQDESGLVFKENLIPQVPIKLYFNSKSELEMIFPVGTGGEFHSFSEKIGE